MSINDEAADILERAADGYESGRYYWSKGNYSSMVFGHQAYCSLGALGHEAGLNHHQLTESTFENNSALAYAVEALALVVNPDTGNFYPAGTVVNWNDREAAKAEVIDVMKHAAKNLRNGEL